MNRFLYQSIIAISLVATGPSFSSIHANSFDQIKKTINKTIHQINRIRVVNVNIRNTAEKLVACTDEPTFDATEQTIQDMLKKNDASLLKMQVLTQDIQELAKHVPHIPATEHLDAIIKKLAHECSTLKTRAIALCSFCRSSLKIDACIKKLSTCNDRTTWHRLQTTLVELLTALTHAMESLVATIPNLDPLKSFPKKIEALKEALKNIGTLSFDERTKMAPFIKQYFGQNRHEIIP